MQDKNRSSPLEAPNSIPWPPILYLVACLIAFGLGQVYKLPWPSGMAGEWLFMSGLLIGAMAIFIDVRTFMELRKHKTTVMPTKSADHLVTTGPFAFSRNPIYLSNTMLCFALAFIFENAWFMAAGLIAAQATHHLAILREERHLEARFGTAWRHYAKKVRRWV